MGACCAPKPGDAVTCKAQDLTSHRWSQSIWAASCVAFAAGWLVPGWRPHLWSASLAAAGILCIVNAFRCGRLHCHITGPLFLLGAVLTTLKANGAVSLSWSVLGTAIVLGTAVAYAPELVAGKYVRRSERPPAVKE